ncbi:ser thr protein phosphatase superfamily [Ophiostoma piceae UAMH 11346]|uniref:Ser thr protein phosphatase superfamily n=1 Tax=Ophiostoma piceae (strain UAMH 11346) TaxID=1262450 RepID=S3CAN5_OPHP1|nr:ser thr protein phosphatase superfamily [Ophiostoma piceae UAMH 11346]
MRSATALVEQGFRSAARFKIQDCQSALTVLSISQPCPPPQPPPEHNTAPARLRAGQSGLAPQDLQPPTETAKDAQDAQYTQYIQDRPETLANGKIQVVSDLHLEVCKQYTTFAVPATGAPYLILAGDIGRLVDYNLLLGFMASVVDAYQLVFYVLGNHEFYTLSYEQAIEQAQRLEKEPCLKGKLILLHKTRWDSSADEDSGHRLTILGCTLWSKIAPEARTVVATRVKDYKNISEWSIDKHCSLHREEAVWLREQVAAIRQEDAGTDSPRTVVVVTHHAPTVEGTSSPKYAANPWTSAFSTELILAPEAVNSGAWQGVSAWVYGHTHYTNEFRCAGTRLVANQRGYVFPSRPVEDGSPVAALAVPRDGVGEDSSHIFDPAKTIPF